MDSYYKNWAEALESLNTMFFNEIKNETSWRNILNYHDTLLVYMNRIIDFGQIYLKYLMDVSQEITVQFNYYSACSILLMVISLILILIGIYFYYSSYERKKLNKLNIKIKKNLLNKTEIKIYRKSPPRKEN